MAKTLLFCIAGGQRAITGRVTARRIARFQACLGHLPIPQRPGGMKKYHLPGRERSPALARSALKFP
ncbi:hypothetical protein EG19_10940 [Thermoanaerobaculum aquaticum]|uniref:Uncharacterized protein n=1 Tax=Thermoanaerobaculum aquaticum TaxID=1312852 RepID=A0A062Y262_9BACT|nr:hypothetical protein EG19_10940 [Thermoanaerobaculum aquaticum]